MTWRQFQLGIAAVFIANCFFSLVVAFAVSPPSRPQNMNTNITHDPRAELREQYAEKAWETMKEKSLNAN